MEAAASRQILPVGSPEVVYRRQLFTNAKLAPVEAISNCPAEGVTEIPVPAAMVLYSNPPAAATPRTWFAVPGALKLGAAEVPEKFPNIPPALAFER